MHKQTQRTPTSLRHPFVPAHRARMSQSKRFREFRKTTSSHFILTRPRTELMVHCFSSTNRDESLSTPRASNAEAVCFLCSSMADQSPNSKSTDAFLTEKSTSLLG